MSTAQEIKAQAEAYNVEFPEALPLIEAGEAEIRVTVLPVGSLGKAMRVISEAGVNCGGRFVSAGEPTVLAAAIGVRDGRLSRVVNAQRRFGRRFANSPVPVRWIDREPGLVAPSAVTLTSEEADAFARVARDRR